MNDLMIGYLAGIIDGEGCIYVNKRKPHGRRKTCGYAVKVCVSITSYELVEWFVKNAQLSSIFEKHPPGNRKTAWLCTWNSSKAEWLLNLVVDHLVIKKEQALIGLELLRHLKQTQVNRGQCVSKDNVQYRQALKEKISKLNKRGRPE